MTIPLDRLKEFEAQVPETGHVSIAVARHQAEGWPSPELFEYAKERSEVLHGLLDNVNPPVVSWGGTDKEHPQEVVEVVVPLVSALIGVIGPGLLAAIANRSKGKGKPSVAGFKVTNSCGDTIEATFKDRSGGTNKEMLEAITTFLTRSVADC